MGSLAHKHTLPLKAGPGSFKRLLGRTPVLRRREALFDAVPQIMNALLQPRSAQVSYQFKRLIAIKKMMLDQAPCCPNAGFTANVDHAGRDCSMGKHIADRLPHPKGVIMNKGVHHIGNRRVRPCPSERLGYQGWLNGLKLTRG